MVRDILKQMIPFIILLVVLWVVAELLDRTMGDGLNVVAPPVGATATPEP